MLQVARYVTIVLSIIAQAVLGALGTGNLLDHLNEGVYLTVNACLAVSGVLSTIFLSIVVLTELAQKEATTTTCLVEVIWAGILWAIITVEASYLSTTRLVHCGQSGSWDLCMSHTIAVPLCWAAAALATIHLAILMLVIDWHRSKGIEALRQEGRARIRAKPPGPLESIKRDFVVLKPVLLQSVYMLIQTKTHMQKPGTGDFNDRRKTLVDRMSRVFRRIPVHSDDKDERAGLRFDIEQGERVGYGEDWGTTSNPYQSEEDQDPFATLLVASPSDASFSPQPRARVADLPRLQLRDEPIVGGPAIPRPRVDRTQARHRRTESRKERLLSTQIRESQASLLASPRSPRSPRRSQTLPSVSAPLPARLNGVAPPMLSRSLTAGTSRRIVPTRYGSMDLTVPDFELGGLSESFKAPPRPPPGFLPRPTGRYR